MRKYQSSEVQRLLDSYELRVCAMVGCPNRFFSEALTPHVNVNVSHVSGLLSYLTYSLGLLRFTDPSKRTVFLYTDARDAATSLYSQQRPTTNYMAMRGIVDKETSMSGRRVPQTLEAYVSSHTDAFQFVRLLTNYKKESERNPGRLMLVKYDSFWEHADEILSFCQVPARLPVKSHVQAPPTTHPLALQLINKFAEYTRLYESLPDVYVGE